MQLFYSQHITGNTAVFDETESQHALQVLRLKEQDTIYLTDGKGKLFEGKVTIQNKKNMSATGLQLVREQNAPKTAVHLVVSPLKNVDRLEWLAEKAVELGISSITPVLTKNTVKKGVNERRLLGIVLSAMKQSLQLHLPHVHPLTEIKHLSFDIENAQYCFGYCGEANKTSIQDISLAVNNVVVMIGPEGDFTPDEVDFLIHHKCVPISLGETRLRTETAAMYALSVLKARLGY